MPIQMTVTSIWFLLLLIVGLLIYYLVPKATQWVVLLLMSICFIFFSTNIYTILFQIFATLVSYISTHLFSKSKCEANPKLKKAVLITSLFLIILPWFFTAASGILISITTKLHNIISFIPVYPPLAKYAALGMGYYTCLLVSYVIDCYWNTIQAQKNPIKLLTYTLFFPQLTTGPISRYENLKNIFEKHNFKYENLCFGSQRILWGFFKKLVLSENASIIVNAIWEDLDHYPGLWRWIALFLYPLWLYCDFSGCMDIILGTAQLFDIHLEENFNNPFFSKTIREFWSRWHITLGKWAKDYVMYPLLKSPKMLEFTRKAKKKHGKTYSKFVSAAIGSGMVWLVMGVWHGGMQHIVGVSLFYWTLIELGELFDPIWEKLYKKTNFNTNTFSFRLFQSIRTYIIFSIGVVFFQAKSVSEAFAFIGSCFKLLFTREYNPWILFDGSILNTGITYGSINLLVIGVILLFVVAFLREKHGYARLWIAQQGIVFRWLIWLTLFFVVLIYGAYGPGFDVSTFIYQRF